MAEKQTGPSSEKHRAVLIGKTAQAVLWLLILCAIVKLREDPCLLLPYLRFTPSQGVSLLSASGVAEDAAAETTPEAPPPAGLVNAAALLGVDLHAPDLQGRVQPIEDPTGLAMRAFYESLLRTNRGQPGAITRILHYGDSLVVVDFLTGQARRRLQSRFGDAGHGYMMAGKPWRWYQHWDVFYRTSDSWKIGGIMSRETGGIPYGLNGFYFDGSGPGQYLEMGTANGGPVGERAGRFEVHYLIQPGGGSFEVSVDGRAHAKVSTVGPAPRSGVYVVKVPDGPHRFRVQCAGDGRVRLFGGVLERDRPGLVYDTLGINGGRARRLELIAPSFWAEQLRLRKPNLVIINFGTNESEDRERPMSQVEADYVSVLQRLRAAAPDASCLVMSPLDRAARVDGALGSNPLLIRLIETQRRAALKAGCAFYSTFQAMGGRGSMARWYRRRPQLCAGDMTHPTRAGAAVVGDGLYRAMVMGWLNHEAGVLATPLEQAAPTGEVEGPTESNNPPPPNEPNPYPPLPERPPAPQ